jgi:hypothetical protein
MLSPSRLIWRPRPPFHVFRLPFLRIGLFRRFDPFVTLLRLEPTVFVKTFRAQTLRLSAAPFPGMLNNSATLPNNRFWLLLLLRVRLPGTLIDPSALYRVRFFGSDSLAEDNSHCRMRWLQENHHPNQTEQRNNDRSRRKEIR